VRPADVERFTEDVLGSMPHGYTDISRVESLTELKPAPGGSSSRQEMFCFGSLVQRSLTPALLDRVSRSEDIALALYGLTLYSESVYMKTGSKLPGIQVTVERVSPLPALRNDPIEGLEFDTLAVQEIEIDRLSRELSRLEAENSSLADQLKKARSENSRTREEVLYRLRRQEAIADDDAGHKSVRLATARLADLIRKAGR